MAVAWAHGWAVVALSVRVCAAVAKGCKPSSSAGWSTPCNAAVSAAASPARAWSTIGGLQWRHACVVNNATMAKHHVVHACAVWPLFNRLRGGSCRWRLHAPV